MVSTRPRARPGVRLVVVTAAGSELAHTRAVGWGGRRGAELTHAHTAEGAGSELAHRCAVGGGGGQRWRKNVQQWGQGERTRQPAILGTSRVTPSLPVM